MPQVKEDFGPFAKLVKLIREYVTTDNIALKACNCASYADINPDTHKWTRKDLYNLATNKIGVVPFEFLQTISKSAVEMNAERTAFTPKALQAQNALTALKPDNKTMIEFYGMIREVNNATQAIRAQLNNQLDKEYEQNKNKAPSGSVKKPITGKKVTAVFEVDHGITIDPSEDKGFDQQTALAILGERGVKVDVDQSHKTPNFEQEALKAVASLKNTVITRAA